MKAYHYDAFDCKIQCEEVYPVDPDEYEAVMRELAVESQAQQGFTEWLDSLEESERAAYLEQATLERKEAQHKDWMGGYSNRQDGDTYNGIAI